MGIFEKIFFRSLAFWMVILLTVLQGVPGKPAFGAQESHTFHSAPAPGAEQEQASQEETKLWTCSMHPQIRLPQPGKCPICGMDLIPLKTQSGDQSKSAATLRELRLSPYAEKLAEIQVHPVERRPVAHDVRMVGKIQYDETRLANITAWVPGRIDKLYVDFTGTVVDKGDPMASIYSPELLAAQQELIQSVRAARQVRRSSLDTIRKTAQATIEASRDKLRLWGLTPRQIDETLSRGTPSDHITIMSPLSGVVVHKDLLEGAYVKTGTPIYTVADLSSVWVKLDAYESDLVWIRKGQKVSFETEAYPGEVFSGTVDFIDPFLNEKTRTVKVRLNAPNPNGKLKPEMFVRAELHASLSGDGEAEGSPTDGVAAPLVIPASAPLITGKRAVVYVAVPEEPGVYEGREIVLGPRAGDHYLVRNGLKEGELIVTHGNFKIDSALQILAKPSMMNPDGNIGSGGHDHGHGGMLPARGEASLPQSDMAVPESFKSGIQPGLDAFEQIQEAVKSERLPEIREGFSDLREILQENDAALAGLLSGHPRMVWMELVMLIENDAVIGSQVETLQEAARTNEALNRHMGRLRRELGLYSAARIAEAAAVRIDEPVPEAFRTRISNLLDAYFAVHGALAHDRFDRVKAGAEVIAKAFSDVDPSVLQGQSRTSWMESASSLEKALSHLKQAGDITTARQHFEPLSEAMATIVKTFGIHPGRPVYQIRCSMAFGGKGATWLQEVKDVQNPYYGETMLGCGDVIETFSGDMKKTGEAG